MIARTRRIVAIQSASVVLLLDPPTAVPYFRLTYIATETSWNMSEVSIDLSNIQCIPRTPKHDGPFDVMTSPEILRQLQPNNDDDGESSSDNDSVIVLKVVRLSQGVTVDRTPPRAKRIKQEEEEEPSSLSTTLATRLFQGEAQQTTTATNEGTPQIKNGNGRAYRKVFASKSVLDPRRIRPLGIEKATPKPMDSDEDFSSNEDVVEDDLSEVASVLESLKGASRKATRSASKNRDDCENFSDLEVQFTPKKKRKSKRKRGDDDDDEDFSPGFLISNIDTSNVRKTRRRAIPTQRYKPVEKVPSTVRVPEKLRKGKAVFKETSSENDSDDDDSDAESSFGEEDAAESFSFGTVEEKDSKNEDSFHEEDFSDAESSFDSSLGGS